MSNDSWKEYFAFSKKQRSAIIILLVVIVVAGILPAFISPNFSKPVIDEKAQALLDAAKNKAVADSVSANNISLTNSLDLFYFDPNTLDADGFKKLGLPDKTIRTILNYRNKGGRFKTAEDIRKIYGLSATDADRLIPYIQIVNNNSNNYTYPQKQTQEITNPTIATIDVNTASEEDFKSLPGIGDVLGKRIVKFRTSIHGFQSVEDLKKTYGLQDSTFQKILPYLTISAYKE